MLSNNKKLIAVIGATGYQGGGVIRALKAGGQFKVRALTRNPGQHRDLADEVIEADLNRSETLAAAFKRRSPRCSGTSKRILIWVRSHATELRSQTK